MEKKRKRTSGHAALKAAGRHPLQIGIPIDDYPAIVAAAEAEGRTVSNFCGVACDAGGPENS